MEPTPFAYDCATEPLRQLTERALAETALLAYPDRDWVRPVTHPCGAHVHDVVIVGAGQAGLGAAFALKREGVSDVLLLDAQPAGSEGVWETFARMPTLRTPKMTTGIECGIPSLSAPAFYKARYGNDAWDAIQRVERPRWMEFLRWFRHVTAPKVCNGVAVLSVLPDEATNGRLLAVTTRPAAGVMGDRHGASFGNSSSASSNNGGQGKGTSTSISDDGYRADIVLARHVVLATGYDGAGSWGIPAHISKAVPSARVSHANGPIEFGALVGKRVGVLGHGASAFDNACVLLERGAASVDLCFRRAKIPLINPHRAVEFAGFLDHFHDLPDDVRWQVGRYFEVYAEPPTQNSFERAHAHAAFRMHEGSNWLDVRDDGSQVHVRTPKGEFVFDHVVCATGSVVDYDARPELKALGSIVQRWRHRYTPPSHDTSEMLGEYPYLGPGFEYQPLEPHGHDWVRRVHAFNFSSVPSMGPHTTSSSGHKYAVPRLVSALTRAFMLEQADAVLPALHAYDFEELNPSAVARR